MISSDRSGEVAHRTADGEKMTTRRWRAERESHYSVFRFRVACWAYNFDEQFLVGIDVIDINMEKYEFDWVSACYCTALISGYQGLSVRAPASSRDRSDTVCGGNATSENRTQQDTMMTVYALRRTTLRPPDYTVFVSHVSVFVNT